VAAAIATGAIAADSRSHLAVGHRPGRAPTQRFREGRALHTQTLGRLTRFVDDPRIPLDNNAAEQALRGPVVGRKNHYGSRSLRGTEVAAVFYTLCETARLIGVDPHAYLLRAVFAAIKQPGTVTFPEDLISGSTTN
jgi:transposase